MVKLATIGKHGVVSHIRKGEGTLCAPNKRNLYPIKADYYYNANCKNCRAYYENGTDTYIKGKELVRRTIQSIEGAFNRANSAKGLRNVMFKLGFDDHNYQIINVLEKYLDKLKENTDENNS